VASLMLEIRGRTMPGKREDLLRLFEEHLAPRAEQNQAQKLVVWAADDTDDDAFVLFEIYSDKTAADANAKAEWFAEYIAASGPLLAGPPTMTLGTPRWTKGVGR